MTMSEKIENQGVSYTEDGAAYFENKNADSLITCFDMLNVEIRYSVRDHRPQYRRDGSDWINFHDRNADSLKQEIERNFLVKTARGFSPLRFGSVLWDECLNALLNEREVDPFKEYLEALPPWDGIQRIDSLLFELFGSREPITGAGEDELNDLASWTARLVFIGSIQRTYDPGCKLDEMPVLIGAQGIGKSAFFRQCLPQSHPEWFADGLDLSGNIKERAEALIGRVIVEVSEMTGSTRADIESLKTFITKQDDGDVRLAYRRNPETLLRRCVLVGTSNKRDCLPNDETGLRRFVPIRCEHGSNVEKYMAEYRDQLWAEAMHLYFNEARRANLPRGAAMEQAAEVAEQHRNRDVIMEDTLNYLNEYEIEGKTLAEIAVSMALVSNEGKQKLDGRTEHRLKKALANLGYVRKREQIDGKRRGVYRKETDETQIRALEL